LATFSLTTANPLVRLLHIDHLCAHLIRFIIFADSIKSGEYYYVKLSVRQSILSVDPSSTGNTEFLQPVSMITIFGLQPNSVHNITINGVALPNSSWSFEANRLIVNTNFPLNQQTKIQWS
jgi:hypothetical protein